jgi:protein-S-isoprenylcysteine O-methyltransferase Ste14
MKQKYFVDSSKGLTFLVILAMMAYFQQWQNPTAWVYLSLHGTYGILWVLKSNIFPDKQWEQDKGLWYGLMLWIGMCLYWVSPLIITSGSVQAPAWLLGICTSLFGFGVFFQFSADMQKYMELKYRPNQLITDGLMSRTRNINYFGELLIYLSFAFLSMHWLPLTILLFFIIVFWAPKMIKKEKSLARYPQFAEYKRKTKLIIPFLF